MLDGLIGFDDGLELMWSLATNSISHVTARDGLLYVVAGKSGALVLAAYALP